MFAHCTDWIALPAREWADIFKVRGCGLAVTNPAFGPRRARQGVAGQSVRRTAAVSSGRSHAGEPVPGGAQKPFEVSISKVSMLREPLTAAAATDMASTLKALADPVRLQLFSARRGVEQLGVQRDCLVEIVDIESQLDTGHDEPDPARVNTVSHLLSCGAGEEIGGELAAVLDHSESTVSHHLASYARPGWWSRVGAG